MQMQTIKTTRFNAFWGCVALGLVALSSPRADTVCASVRIEIQQEVTLERQAFDATMKIHNGLADVPLTDVNIEVNFTDESGRAAVATSDPYQTNALFFVRESSLSGIDRFSAGTVNGGDSAELHWLIIPAYGAGGTNGLGRYFFVGATLTYRIRGELETVAVVPDRIWVKPMPLLVLDYFLPRYVIGDDPLTTTIEASVPYNLGVRALNAGSGAAEKLKIDSAQPRIVDNTQGVLIGFELLGSEVNGVSGGNSLLVDFGTVAAGKAGVARWIMTSSLAGRFVEFDAWFTHSDELGGELTSLMREVRTHVLLRDVLVDLPDRDNVRDFLTKETDGSLLLFESDAFDGRATNLSAQAVLTAQTNENRYVVTMPKRTGPLYAEFPFAAGVHLEFLAALRDDGKQMSPANVWISKTREHSSDPWEYSLHLFDYDGGGRYVIDFGLATNVENQAPVLAYVGNRVGYEGQTMSFLVQASDPDLTIPSLSVTGLPVGATFEDRHDGTGEFVWTPPQGSYGVHPVRFLASDDEYTTWRIGRIYVGRPGEKLNAAGIPESLVNWSVEISSLDAYTDSGVATVGWHSVEGVFYDVYASDNPFVSSPSWSKVGVTMAGRPILTESEDSALGTQRTRRYYQVVLAGDSPNSNQVWGVVRSAINSAGYFMLSPPLNIDRSFAGELGHILADQLDGSDGGVGDQVGDEVFVLEDSGSWRTLYLDGQGIWRESNGETTSYELPVGRGLWVARYNANPIRFTFSGPVGNSGTNRVAIPQGWSIIGLSEGRELSIKSALAGAAPHGGAAEEEADMLVRQKTNGAWQRMMYIQGWGAPYDGNWFDLSTFQIVTNRIQPGEAYYYFRQPAAGSTEVSF